MRRELAVAVCVLVFAAMGVAQTKVESKWHCGKMTTEKSVEVGDEAGHTYGIAQGNCEAKSSSIGEKTGTFTEFAESRGSQFTSRGQFSVTFDNGDKVIHSYEAKGDLDKKTVQEKWKVASGTGKYKGAKGEGTCTGKLNEDGTSDWECSGTISAGK